jgi:hypothetical protein
MKDLERMRIECQHGVGAFDHRAVPDVDAVESSDRDVTRARDSVFKRGDANHPAGSITTSGR